MSIRIFVIFIALSFTIQSRAYPFIPDLKYIYSKLTKNNASLKTVKINQERIIYLNEDGDKEIIVNETVYLQKPWKYAKKSILGDKLWMEVYDGSKIIVLVDGKWTYLNEKFSMPPIYGFYLSTSPEELSAFVSAMGIESAETSFERKNGSITLALSPAQGNKNNMMWLDRESFKPLAFSIAGYKSQSGDFLFTFSDYRKFSDRIFFPGTTKIFDSQVLKEKIKVKSFDTSSKFSKKLFDLDYIQSSYKKLTGKLPREIDYWIR